MAPIPYDEDDIEEAAEYSLDWYDGEETVENTVDEMLTHLDGQP